MLPKCKTLSTPPHITDDEYYKELSLPKTQAKKARRLDRKRKTITKYEIRELDKIQYKNYRTTNLIQQANRYRNIAKYSLNDFNFELEDSFDLSIWQHKLSNLNIRYNYCQALKWKNESPGFCCLNGKIKLALFEPPLLAISQLLTRFDITTSITTNRSIFEVNKSYIFRIQEALYYNIGSLISPTELDHINPFVQIFQSARRQATRNPALKLKISNISSQVMRNYNLLVVSEIAAIITDDDTIDFGRDIILTTQQ
ncbi:36277_t:CDS:2, partial [Racocetra persica]